MDHVGRQPACSDNSINMISRATKSQQSQNFSAVFKVYETSTNQISRSYHKRIPSYQVKEKSKLIIRSKLGQTFLAAQFFSLSIIH